MALQPERMIETSVKPSLESSSQQAENTHDNQNLAEDGPFEEEKMLI